MEPQSETTLQRGKNGRLKKPRPQPTAEDLAAFEQFCCGIASGLTHKVLFETQGVDWTFLSGIMQFDPARMEEYNRAIKLGDAYRKAIRRDAIHERAVEGVEEPMVSAGQLVCTKRVYSDGLLQTLVKADHPELFVQNIKADVTTHHDINRIVQAIEERTPIGEAAKMLELEEG